MQAPHALPWQHASHGSPTPRSISPNQQQKGGSRMKKVCNMSFEDRQFVLKLLHATKDDFERAFQDLAKSDSIKGKRRFVANWCELAELAFGQPEEEEGGEV